MLDWSLFQWLWWDRDIFFSSYLYFMGISGTDSTYLLQFYHDVQWDSFGFLVQCNLHFAGDWHFSLIWRNLCFKASFQYNILSWWRFSIRVCCFYRTRPFEFIINWQKYSNKIISWLVCTLRIRFLLIRDIFSLPTTGFRGDFRNIAISTTFRLQGRKNLFRLIAKIGLRSFCELEWQ